MRMLHAKVKPEEISRLQHFYDSVVFTTLQKTPGCSYACLIQSTQNPEDGISMTLWNSKEDAESYEQSGVFRKLIDQTRPYLADSTEWTLQLSKELTLEYSPVPEEPAVKSYAVTASGGTLPSFQQSPAMHLRIVSVKINPQMVDEFKSLYEREIIPALHSVKGCRYVYLTQNSVDKTEGISVTIWDSQRDAEEYEKSGLFDLLKSKVKHTFTELSQWKMELEKSHRGTASSSDDLSVGAYKMVAGKSFQVS